MILWELEQVVSSPINSLLCGLLDRNTELPSTRKRQNKSPKPIASINQTVGLYQLSASCNKLRNGVAKVRASTYWFASSMDQSFSSGSGSDSQAAVCSQNVTWAAMIEGLMGDWKGHSSWVTCTAVKWHGCCWEASVLCHMTLFTVLFEQPPDMASF